VKLSRSKRRLFGLLAIILVALFWFRPGANGLRKRIVNSVGLALGRNVEVDWVKVRILPQPGFDLVNFVVHDDPNFSAEPMLRAQEVTAVLRLRSLLRGRFEIGRLSLKEPSFNLVRRDDGHWNLESLLERAARTPAAPTSHTKPEARPVFPYIEADNGRINFKVGQEKKAYALTNADFALWLESENQWGMRLAAQPVRTDFNLSDTGTLRVAGTWQRSDSLRQTPLKFTLEWKGAQLGQFTKLLRGTDKGWRGGLTITASFSGIPADLSVDAQASVQDFRRYDIVSSEPLQLAARCSAHYSSLDHLLSPIVCRSPVGAGIVSVAGQIAAPTGPRSYDLTLTAQEVPVQSLVALARRSKKDLPADLAASGTFFADLSLHTNNVHGQSSLEWKGSGETRDLRLRSQATRTELVLGRIPFSLSSQSTPSSARNLNNPPALSSRETHLDIGPFTMAMGKFSSADVRGWIGRSGYSIFVDGDAQVQRLLQVAQTLGLRTVPPTAEGLAKLNLQIAGAWTGFAAPAITGTAQLRSVHAEVRGLNGPIEIASANLLLSDSGVQVRKLTASAAETHWSGSLSFPRQCTSLATCPVSFDLQADKIVAAQLQDWFTSRASKGPWYRFLSPGAQEGPSLLSTLNARGTLVADHLVIADVTANHVSGDLDFQDGEVRLSKLQADVLGGRYRGAWEANFRASPLTFSGTGSLERVSLAQVAEAMHDGWITGIGNATYKFAASGSSPREMLDSATGSLQFDLREGLLPHITLAAGNPPLHIRRLSASLSLHAGVFQIQRGKLETPSGIYQISGTASLGQHLEVRLARSDARGFNVTGTLSAPHVLPSTPETQAALKP
jgi:hypothetical protein